jgi:hypothetical protein
VTDAAGNPLAADASWSFTTTAPPPPDTTPPTVTATSPIDGATGVAAGANVTATFSEAMTDSTITTSSFTLVVQGTTDVLAAAVSYDAASRTATLNPTSDLLHSTTYLATLKGGDAGVKDAAGNPLAADATWTFTTAAAPAPSVFPVVQSVTASTFVTDTTTHQVAMPPAVSVDDLLVCVFTSDGNATVTAPTGWTQIGTLTSGTTIRLSIHLRRATGSEAGTSVNFVTGAAEKAAAQVYRISGSFVGTIAGAEQAGYSLAMVSGPASTTPNPPALNPGTWDVENVLWLAVEAVDNLSGAVTSPASYSDGVASNTPTGTGRVSLASARRANAVAAEDPGVFRNIYSQAWVTATLAIRPGAAAPPP